MEIILLLLVYFLPAMIAGGREHHNGGAIFALNLFLGWTLLGWVWAFVWSLTATQKGAPKPPAEAAAAARPSGDAVSELERLGALRDKGVIDEAEFARLKARVTDAAV